VATPADALGDPYSLFRPREIFPSAGKRSRGDFEGSLLACDPLGGSSAGAPSEIPSETEIRDAIMMLHSLSRFTPGCLVVALIYIERLRRGAGAQMLASTWQPTLLMAIIVAQKVWEDKPHMMVDYTQLCQALTLQQLNSLERHFLKLLDYNVGVKAAIYTDWYFRLGTMCERNAMGMRPLDGAEARRLEIHASLYESRVRGETRASSGPLPQHDHDRQVTPRSRAVIS